MSDNWTIAEVYLAKLKLKVSPISRGLKTVQKHLVNVSYSWWFSIFSPPFCLTVYCYCEEKLDDWSLLSMGNTKLPRCKEKNTFSGELWFTSPKTILTSARKVHLLRYFCHVIFLKNFLTEITSPIRKFTRLLFARCAARIKGLLR